MFARRYKSYAWALLVGGVLGCNRPRWPATLSPTNSARAAAAERPTLLTSLPRRRFEGGPWWGRESTSAGAAAGRGRLLQAGAPGFQPALELGRVRDEKPFQQCTPIQVERLLQLSIAERALEGGDVARYLSEVQADLLVAPACDGVAAQRV